MPTELIHVELIYAGSKKQVNTSLDVTLGTTIDRAIKQSGILAQCSELHLDTLRVGIWCEARRLSDVLKAGDRIEIYRPLLCDPKKARRDRAG